jgi:hypothetical protein
VVLIADVGRELQALATVIDAEREDRQIAILVFDRCLTVADHHIGADAGSLCITEPPREVESDVEQRCFLEDDVEARERFDRCPLRHHVHGAAEVAAAGGGAISGAGVVAGSLNAVVPVRRTRVAGG